MAAPTLDRVLTDAETLSPDDQELLEGLLRHRRIETWRRETAVAAKEAMNSFRAGKLKPQSAESIIARLRRGK